MLSSFSRNDSEALKRSMRTRSCSRPACSRSGTCLDGATFNSLRTRRTALITAFSHSTSASAWAKSPANSAAVGYGRSDSVVSARRRGPAAATAVR